MSKGKSLHDGALERTGRQLGSERKAHQAHQMADGTPVLKVAEFIETDNGVVEVVRCVWRRLYLTSFSSTATCSFSPPNPSLFSKRCSTFARRNDSHLFFSLCACPFLL